VVLPLALNADVTVTGQRTFANLADVEILRNLVGIVQSASQGAVTAKHLDERPLMRDGEVLETVPGVIVAQHSGEGRAMHQHHELLARAELQYDDAVRRDGIGEA
jgi:hypothetical protein